MFLHCRDKILDLSQPRVMGILNITPDSFCAVGRFSAIDQALQHAEQMVAAGAAIIDVGGEPTNPSVHPVIPLQEELDRVIPVVEALAQRISVPISVDTSKPEVMHAAIARGANFINDVRALQKPGAMDAVVATQVPVCLMHMTFPEGKTTTAAADVETEKSSANNILPKVIDFLAARIEACVAAGISRDKIIVDPGIGGGNFGKNVWQNLHLLAKLAEIKRLGVPLLVGVSRKSFIGELLNAPVEQRLYGSLAAATIAVLNGADIIRAHDVKATVDTIKIATAIIDSK